MKRCLWLLSIDIVGVLNGRITCIQIVMLVDAKSFPAAHKIPSWLCPTRKEDYATQQPPVNDSMSFEEYRTCGHFTGCSRSGHWNVVLKLGKQIYAQFWIFYPSQRDMILVRLPLENISRGAIAQSKKKAYCDLPHVSGTNLATSNSAIVWCKT